MNSLTRSTLIVPCFNTSRIYIIGIDDLYQMRVMKIIELRDFEMLDLSFPLHCFSCPGAKKPLFLSALGKKNGDNKGTVTKLDRKLFTFKAENPEKDMRESRYGGTFAVHPRQNVLITTEWSYFLVKVKYNFKNIGSPEILLKGLEFDDNEKCELLFRINC